MRTLRSPAHARRPPARTRARAKRLAYSLNPPLLKVGAGEDGEGGRRRDAERAPWTPAVALDPRWGCPHGESLAQLAR